MLNDVVVHVHQDAARGGIEGKKRRCREQSARQAPGEGLPFAILL